MWDKEKIKGKIVSVADRYGFNNPQQMAQLERLLLKCDPQEVYEGLIGVFKQEQEESSDRQEYAGRLLYVVNPKASFDLFEDIRDCLPFYDKSVEHMPFYFAKQRGLDEVVATVDRYRVDELTERENESLSTIKFWLRRYNSWKMQHNAE